LHAIDIHQTGIHLLGKEAFRKSLQEFLPLLYFLRGVAFLQERLIRVALVSFDSRSKISVGELVGHTAGRTHLHLVRNAFSLRVRGRRESDDRGGERRGHQHLTYGLCFHDASPGSWRNRYHRKRRRVKWIVAAGDDLDPLDRSFFWGSSRRLC
jgi:hypothetical protein